MMIRLLSQAVHDLESGTAFYESQRPGLGTYFQECLSSDIESLRTYAGIHERYRGYFRALSSRFPFSIYYQLNDGCIDVYAVFDARQDPHAIDAALNRR